MKKGTVAAISTILGAAAGALTTGKMTGKAIDQKKEKIDKFKSYYNVLNQWLILKQEGKSLENYFLNNGYKTLAIYGMGEMGNRLYEELKNTSVQIIYTIDKNAACTYSELDVIEPEEDFSPVDAIVVTAIFDFVEIEKKLEKKTDFPIISLEDVVYEV